MVLSSIVVVVSIIPLRSKHILPMLDLILSCLFVLLFGRYSLQHHFVNQTNTLDCSTAWYINDKSLLTKHQMSNLNYLQQILSITRYQFNKGRHYPRGYKIDMRNIIWYYSINCCVRSMNMPIINFINRIRTHLKWTIKDEHSHVFQIRGHTRHHWTYNSSLTPKIPLPHHPVFHMLPKRFPLLWKILFLIII